MIFLTHRRGFTLIELMVTVGIFAAVSSVILARNSKFDDETLLQSAAYEVALSVRSAQNYGINVLGQGQNFDNPYGVYFTGASNTYVLFVDSDGDNFFDSDETLETFTLGRGFTIEKICTFIGTNPECSESSLKGDVTIVFRRPNPEAIMSATGESVGGISGVGIEVASPRGGQRFIIVQQTGQIAVMRSDAVSGSELPTPPPQP